jgi:spore coat polysaccharide biosynthesis protein SpsF (cytidylyltransferase family)
VKSLLESSTKYAREIKKEFTTPLFSWNKGKYKCTYLDLENGYDLRLLCVSKAEGIRVVRSVLKILDKTFKDDNFQFIENMREFPDKPGTHKVYGKIVKKFRQRPTAVVKFTHAQLLIPGQVKPVNLVSVNGRVKTALENVNTF